MQINKRQFEKWMTSLDSGKYSQTVGELQNGGGYCCLGVACKVLMPDKKLKKDTTLNKVYLYGGLPDDQPYAPAWLKDINDDFYKIAGETIADMNDSMDLSFPEIATCLELVYVHKMLD